jgi:ribosomal protein L5
MYLALFICGNTTGELFDLSGKSLAVISATGYGDKKFQINSRQFQYKIVSGTLSLSFNQVSDTQEERHAAAIAGTENEVNKRKQDMEIVSAEMVVIMQQLEAASDDAEQLAGDMARLASIRGLRTLETQGSAY